MIKASIVLLAAWVVIPRLTRRSAAERHALWTAALGMAALLPVLAWLLPPWEPAWAQRAAGAWPAAFQPLAVHTTGDVVIRATGIEAGRWTLGTIAVGVWIGGSLLLLVVLARQVLRLRSLIGDGFAPPLRHRQIAGRVAAALSLALPRLTCGDRVPVPLAFGVRRAHLLLPRAAHDWSDARVWAVCAHEMAHVSRGDWIAHLAAELACRVYWFNPLFWMARSRMSRESERAADDIVIELGADGTEYASHLIAIVRAAHAGAAVSPAVSMAGISGFEHRIRALLDALVNRARLSRRGIVAILGGACLVAGPLAALGAGTLATIDIQTSNLQAIDALDGRDLAGDGSEPVREIRLLSPVIGDAPPSVAEYTTPPLYSDDARRQAVEGNVLVRAHIDTNGRVRQARVVQGLGAGLDQNALVALRQWRFHPGTRHGAAVEMDVEIDVAFTLRNDSINTQIANDMVTLVGPGVTPPQVVRTVSPRPPDARVTGTVVLDVVLLEDGTPRIVRILRSLGTDLDDAAVEAFAQWRFSPAQKDGRPIKVRMNTAVRFHG